MLSSDNFMTRKERGLRDIFSNIEDIIQSAINGYVNAECSKQDTEYLCSILPRNFDEVVEVYEIFKSAYKNDNFNEFDELVEDYTSLFKFYIEKLNSKF